MIYNEKQWEIIEQASPHYLTARREYIRNAPRWLTEQIIEVYENATGKTIMSKDLSCSVCVLHIYQQIGRTYFSDLEEREKIKEKNNTENGNNRIREKATNEKDDAPSKQGNAKKKKRDSKSI